MVFRTYNPVSRTALLSGQVIPKMIQRADFLTFSPPEIHLPKSHFTPESYILILASCFLISRLLPKGRQARLSPLASLLTFPKAIQN